MVNVRPFHRIRARKSGALTTELVVAMGVLAAAIIPLSFGFLLENRILKDSYQDAVAMEIVDGEMEILAAGGWSRFPEGEHVYAVQAESAKNLPPGKFVLLRTPGKLRLEWRRAEPGKGRPQARELTLP